jgi:hypothetical protein
LHDEMATQLISARAHDWHTTDGKATNAAPYQLESVAARLNLCKGERQCVGQPHSRPVTFPPSLHSHLFLTQGRENVRRPCAAGSEFFLAGMMEVGFHSSRTKYWALPGVSPLNSVIGCDACMGGRQNQARFYAANLTTNNHSI